MDASNKVYANYEEYCQYIKAEDYKDDKYAKGREIAADQEEQEIGYRNFVRRFMLW